jgi:hypothetical protein
MFPKTLSSQMSCIYVLPLRRYTKFLAVETNNSRLLSNVNYTEETCYMLELCIEEVEHKCLGSLTNYTQSDQFA